MARPTRSHERWDTFNDAQFTRADIAHFALSSLVLDARFVVKERPNFGDMPASDSTSNRSRFEPRLFAPILAF